MDRREALKKLAAGSAVAFASPLILKSTAFADSGTASCLPTALSASTFAAESRIFRRSEGDAAEYVELRVTNAAFTGISCPAGYNQVQQFRWTVNSSPVDVTIRANAGLSIVEDLWRQFQVVRIVDPGTTTNTLSTTGSYEIQAVVRVACVSPTRVCWRCVTVVFNFTWTYDASATASTITGGSISGNTSNAACNSNPPDPAPLP